MVLSKFLSVITPHKNLMQDKYYKRSQNIYPRAMRIIFTVNNLKEKLMIQIFATLWQVESYTKG